MYYDDETRHHNLLSGFIFGALLGAGLVLIARAPQEGVPAGRLRTGRGR